MNSLAIANHLTNLRCGKHVCSADFFSGDILI